MQQLFVQLLEERYFNRLPEALVLKLATESADFVRFWLVHCMRSMVSERELAIALFFSAEWALEELASLQSFWGSYVLMEDPLQAQEVKAQFCYFVPWLKTITPRHADAISVFVTRGKGVSIHRADCGNFRQMALRSGDRVIEVDWGQSSSAQALVYPVDVNIEALDRQGLLRDISEVFAKEKMNVIGVQTQSVKGTAWMTFTVEIGDAVSLSKVLVSVRAVKGVRAAKRR